MDALIGQRLGKYEIRREIGRGGMSAIYLAYQADMDREVAVKVLPREFIHQKSFLERFRLEAKSIARLQHPHILPVLDYGEEGGWTYIAMVYMPGGSLAERIKREGNQMPLGEISRMIGQIADALDFAHRQGIIHRDLKPGNVLLDRADNVYLSDFGIAKVAESSAALTGTGVVGSPAYMAPEMGEPGALTSLVDIYAMGVILYQMITGQLPYNADTPIGILMAHAVQPIPDARMLRRDVAEAVQAVIVKAMSKDPHARYPTGRALAEALEAAVSGAGYADFGATSPMLERPTPTPPPPASSEYLSTLAEGMSAPPPPQPYAPPYDPNLPQTVAELSPLPGYGSPNAYAPPVVAAPRRRGRGAFPLAAGLFAAAICLGVVAVAAWLGVTYGGLSLPFGPATPEPGGAEETEQPDETQETIEPTDDEGEANAAQTAAALDAQASQTAAAEAAARQAEAEATASAEAAAAAEAARVEAARALAPAAPASWTLTRYDTFDEDTGEWFVGTTTVNGGSWAARLAGGVYEWSLSGPVSSSWDTGWYLNPVSDMPDLGNLTDFYVSVDLSIDNDEIYDFCGFKFRQVDDQNFYYYFVSTGGGRFLNGRVFANNIQRDSDLSSGLINRGQINRLGVLAQGTQFTFYVNGSDVDTYLDTGFRSGSLVLGCVNASSQGFTALFDNFAVFQP